MIDNKNSQVRLDPLHQKSGLPVGVHLIIAMIFLLGAIIYTISPIDFIPDLLVQLGG